MQNTLETEQQHAAVYSPGVKETPEQTPDQVAAVSGSANAVHSKIPGEDSWLSKHARREKQQDGVAKSDKEGAQSKGASFATVVQCIYLAYGKDCKVSSKNCIGKSVVTTTQRMMYNVLDAHIYIQADQQHGCSAFTMQDVMQGPLQGWERTPSTNLMASSHSQLLHMCQW